VPAVWQSHDAGVRLESRQNLGVAWVDAITFADPRSGWIAGPLTVSATMQTGEPALLHTTDGGASWNIVQLPAFAPGRLSSLNVIASGNRVLVTGLYQPPDRRIPGGVVLRSEDGGQTWSEALRLPPSEDRDSAFTQIQISGSTVMVAGFQAGAAVLEVSRDGGRSFAALNAPARSIAISMVDSMHVYLVAAEYLGPASLYATEDGGGSWNKVAEADRGFASLQFVSAMRGYALFAAGQAGTTLRVTADAGRSWHDVTTIPEGLIAGESGGVVLGLTIAADGTGYIVCSDALYRGRL
jgi:photosystem II stability/assembly factor-like uncharacterized protein